MIGKLRGIVDVVRQDQVILEVGGVGYQVFASMRTLDQLQHSSGEVSLFIETHVREDHIHLYGFLSEVEQEYFTLLTTVQGVGNRMALAILSTFEAQEVGNIILAQDVTALTRVSGIGKRIAERIVTELKNKLPSFGADIVPMPSKSKGSVAPTGDMALLSDAVSALENLGYARSDAHKAAHAALQEGAESLDALITGGLKRLAG